MSFDQDEFDAQRYQQAVSRTKVPAIMLLMVGMLNMFMNVGVLLREGVTYHQLSPEERVAKAKVMWEQVPDNVREMYRNYGVTKKEFLQQMPLVFQVVLWWGIVGLIGGILVTFGGWKMMHFRGWGFALTGSIVACLPFVSCLGCVGIGQIVGIWSIVILCNADVQMLFRAQQMPDSNSENQNDEY